jgi:hypothetical protein
MGKVRISARVNSVRLPNDQSGNKVIPVHAIRIIERNDIGQTLKVCANAQRLLRLKTTARTFAVIS